VLTDTAEAEVRRLRTVGVTPKRIARQLGLPPHVVARLVADLAAQRPGSDELVGCWVSPGWSRELVVPSYCQWPDGDPGRNDATGIVAVLVARHHRYEKVGICGYLVDVHCLGVKNAVGPRILEPHKVNDFTADFFAAFDGEPVAAPLDLAQHLVFGAVAYARGLGFEPHSDFARAAAYLGDWREPSAITFGRDGKPFYMQGPYDDVFSIMQTLNRTVGRGNYHFMVGVG
jgi:hypothetical protein